MFRATALAAVLAVLTAVLPVAADDAPDAAKVKRAADEFDLGVQSFKSKQFDEAAQHFEAADEAVPGVKTLRLAMRARSEAGQGSRAASLAAQALERYAEDAETAKLAKETIARFEGKLHKVQVSCASPCLLAVGTRAVHGAVATRWILYVDPGKTSINASFFGNASSKPQSVVATAGGHTEIRFEPTEPPKVIPTATATQTATPTATGSATSVPTSSSEIPPDTTGAPTSTGPEGDAPQPKGIHPAFFFTGLALTLGAGGVLAWSGVDTLQNPGTEAVRKACAGKGPDCPEYKLGLDNQLRTNVLIGATAGVGAVTVLFAIFTRWSSGKPIPKTAVLPTATVLDRGAAFGITGVLE
jgi:hypothetical protein